MSTPLGIAVTVTGTTTIITVTTTRLQRGLAEGRLLLLQAAATLDRIAPKALSMSVQPGMHACNATPRPAAGCVVWCGVVCGVGWGWMDGGG